MAIELTCLAWAVILGLLHIFIAANLRTKELGIEWNMSPRDGEDKTTSVLVERLYRAQANFFETFPLFAAAVLLVAVTQNYTVYSQLGAIVYLVARVIYFPLYALGIPVVRSLVWITSIIGLLLVLAPLLF